MPHLGCFSTEYKAMFGEWLSDTLRRAVCAGEAALILWLRGRRILAMAGARVCYPTGSGDAYSGYSRGTRPIPFMRVVGRRFKTNSKW